MFNKTQHIAFIIALSITLLPTGASAQNSSLDKIEPTSISTPGISKPQPFKSPGISPSRISRPTVPKPQKIQLSGIARKGVGASRSIKSNQTQISRRNIGARAIGGISGLGSRRKSPGKAKQSAPLSKPLKGDAEINAQPGESEMEVQVLVPGPDGFEIIPGKAYVPDMNQEEWIFLPLEYR